MMISQYGTSSCRLYQTGGVREADTIVAINGTDTERQASVTADISGAEPILCGVPASMDPCTPEYNDFGCVERQNPKP